MIASFSWLRALCPVPDDVQQAAEALTSRGLTVDAVEPSGDDHALDIDVPANRPDCLGHLGLARELSAAFGIPLAASDPEPPVAKSAPADEVQVAIDAPDLCSRYSARLVRNIRVGNSPAWVVKRLEVCGLRSINNVVDASNLVMLELGNPIHFFDFGLLQGKEILVRRAAKGESLKSLDGEQRRLDPEMLVIADRKRAIALAGVIGGADTEINSATRDVLIEAACFLPRSVRATSRSLGLKTDASFRFERGVDPEGVIPAQQLATRLLVELCSGEMPPEIIDIYPAPSEPSKLSLRLGQVGRLLGYQPAADLIESSLAALQLAPRRLDAERMEITVPSWRMDLEREADIVEEVARHLGYDDIPTVAGELPFIAAVSGKADIEERARDLLAHAGFHEALGYAMIAEKEDQPFVSPDAPDALRLTNPIAEWLAALRRSIMPGLLRAVDLNQRRGVRDVRLFEIGHVFIPSGGERFPTESSRVGLVWSGQGQPPHWALPGRDADLFDLMGMVELLLHALCPEARFERARGSFPGYHPGLAVAWKSGSGDEVAWCGPLHPDLQNPLAHPAQIAEIDLDLLGGREREIPQYSPLPRLTAINRDLSVTMTPGTTYGAVLEAMQAVTPPVPVEIRPVDSYTGPPLEAGDYSLTVRFILQPAEKSLKEEEIERYRQDLIDVIDKRLGLKIRT
jgi:phenylalanyl-tRNA synthetase beta chain